MTSLLIYSTVLYGKLAPIRRGCTGGAEIMSVSTGKGSRNQDDFLTIDELIDS